MADLSRHVTDGTCWCGHSALREVALDVLHPDRCRIPNAPDSPAPVTSRYPHTKPAQNAREETPMSLVEHARRELALIGEDQDVTEWMISVIERYASFGHSGGSHSVCLPRLTQLLNFEPLAPLTDNPDEWTDHSAISGYPIWQSVRNSKAFSGDGGKTYWLLDEREAAGSAETTPLHRSEPANPRS
jgi:hypothetical protein